MPSPIVLIGGHSTTDGYKIDPPASEPFTLENITLADYTGVNSWELKCIYTSDWFESKLINTELTYNKAKRSYSLVMSNSSATLVFQSTINDRKDINGNFRSDYSTTFEIIVYKISGTERLSLVPQGSTNWLKTINRIIELTPLSGPPAWSPLDDPTLIAWYGLDNTKITTNGLGNVSQWADSSHNVDSNRNATNASGIDNQPTYISADSNFNNHPTLGFTSTQQRWLQTSTFSTAITQPATYYVVCKPGPNLGAAEIIVDSKNASDRLMIANDPVNGGRMAIYAGNYNTGSTTGLNATKHITCTVFDTTSSYNYTNNYHTPDIGPVNAGSGKSVALTIGHAADFSNSPFNGTIACIAIYSGAHDESQRQTIMTYLSTQFDIAVSGA